MKTEHDQLNFVYQMIWLKGLMGWKQLNRKQLEYLRQKLYGIIEDIEETLNQ